MMEEKYLVSIIIPAYNIEEFIIECIESVRNQTYSNFEAIIVDDGSTDNTRKLIEEYILNSEDKRMKLVQKANGGLSDARNCGMKIAEGDFFTFIDGDDVVDQNYLHCLVSLYGESQNAEICCVNYKRFSIARDLHDLYDLNGKKSKSMIIDHYDFLNNYYCDSQITNTGVAWGKLFKRELFKDICFPVGRLHEDIATMYKLYLNTDKIAVSDAELYFYRSRQGSIMKTFTDKNYRDMILAYLELLDIPDNNIDILKQHIAKDAFYQMRYFMENYFQKGNEWLASMEKKKRLNVFYSYLNMKQRLVLSLYRKCKAVPCFAGKIKRVRGSR